MSIEPPNFVRSIDGSEKAETDSSTAYSIVDVIEVKTAYGAPAPGFILVPANFRPASPEKIVGELVMIEPPGGCAILGKIARTRDHGTTTSILVENWPTDFPSPGIGWAIRVPAVDGAGEGIVSSHDKSN